MSYGSITAGNNKVPGPPFSNSSPSGENGSGTASAAVNTNGRTSETIGPEAFHLRESTLWGRLRAFYDENIGLFFIFLAQMFGSIVWILSRLQRDLVTDIGRCL